MVYSLLRDIGVSGNKLDCTRVLGRFGLPLRKDIEGFLGAEYPGPSPKGV